MIGPPETGNALARGVRARRVAFALLHGSDVQLWLLPLLLLLLLLLLPGGLGVVTTLWFRVRWNISRKFVSAGGFL